MKIKVKSINHTYPMGLKILQKGDWIDLVAAQTLTLKGPSAETLKRKRINNTDVSKREVVFEDFLIPLGIAMELPEGYEAIVSPRSSIYKNFGIILANSIGVIDNSYNGDDDEWKFHAVALRDTTINRGDRICQFRIQLSQKATIWQKIKWLFSNGIKLEYVDKLHNRSRGGYGSTGK